ncbi:IS110 family transposase [Myroides sp. TSA_177.3]|uniref:IS110 family transposase n=1 Tax=Myroides sp. TSA_177.3 TaxID=3415650 RepID=UPI004045B1AA
MSKFKHFVGIDISKEYFDVTILTDSKSTFHNQFSNDKDGVKELLKWIKSNQCFLKDTLICMEHTGIYKSIIVENLLKKRCYLWVEMAYRIVHSNGVQRGKNDKIDSERIAIYAKKNQEDVTLFKAPRDVLKKIQVLLRQRDTYKKKKTALTSKTNELKGFEPKMYAELSVINNNVIKEIEKAIEAIDQRLQELIKEDQEVYEIYKLVISVIGVGTITAMALIYYTNMFTSFETPRQLASYCGVVPFEHTSGKSIRGKPKVHHMSNKTLKRLLYLCAMSSIQHDPVIKNYYQRQSERGKNNMLTINNIKNKLLMRICSCVRNKKKYVVNQAA